MAKINLIAWNNQVGLGQDLILLTHALVQLGHQVFMTPAGPRRSDGSLRARCHQLLRRNRPIYDINIMLEHIRPAFCWMAPLNLFIPNPEWFSARDAKSLHLIDAVFTKTIAATRLFTPKHPATHYVGFTSVDKYAPEVAKTQTFLHLSGASKMKGTQRLIATWRRHPEWPLLTVYQSYPPCQGDGEAANICRTIARLDAESVRVLQNRHRYHLCLSEAEGWGHYIVEAMSCAAVVFVCDAAPMNELISPDRGRCITASTAHSINQSPCWKFNVTAFEDAIRQTLSMTSEDADRIGHSARRWYVQNHGRFLEQLQAAIEQL